MIFQLVTGKRQRGRGAGGSGRKSSQVPELSIFMEPVRYPEAVALSKMERFEDGSFHCSICTKTFKKSSHCKEHIITRHSIPVDMVCQLCDKVVKNSVALRQHMKFKHPAIL